MWKARISEGKPSVRHKWEMHRTVRVNSKALIRKKNPRSPSLPGSRFPKRTFGGSFFRQLSSTAYSADLRSSFIVSRARQATTFEWSCVNSFTNKQTTLCQRSSSNSEQSVKSDSLIDNCRGNEYLIPDNWEITPTESKTCLTHLPIHRFVLKQNGSSTDLS